jgi:hypothetical protein
MWKWILLVLQSLQPNTPYKDTYEQTARAIDDVAHESPLYDSEDGVVRTIAEVVAIGHFESSFNPRAVGDHGNSLGFGQIGVSNLAYLGLSGKEDLFDVRQNVRAMIRMLRDSHRTCAIAPLEDQLAAYATGNGHCFVSEGISASKHRMALAKRILVEHQPFWTEPEVAPLP